MRSMTGYGYAERRSEDFDLSVEIKSVNNRYLDIYISLPSYMSGMELELKKIVGDHALRGKIEIFVRVSERAGGVKIAVNETVARAVGEALARIQQLSG